MDSGKHHAGPCQELKYLHYFYDRGDCYKIAMMSRARSCLSLNIHYLVGA